MASLSLDIIAKWPRRGWREKTNRLVTVGQRDKPGMVVVGQTDFPHNVTY